MVGLKNDTCARLAGFSCSWCSRLFHRFNFSFDMLAINFYLPLFLHGFFFFFGLYRNFFIGMNFFRNCWFRMFCIDSFYILLYFKFFFSFSWQNNFWLIESCKIK